MVNSRDYRYGHSNNCSEFECSFSLGHRNGWVVCVKLLVIELRQFCIMRSMCDYVVIMFVYW